MEELKAEQDEVIPKNIRAQIDEEIKKWEKSDQLFVSTRASDCVMECLQDNSCVTLTGSGGVGKTFIARHTALVLQKERYKVIPIYSPTDIRDYYQPGKKTVFIVDDICGNFNANQYQIELWKQLLPVIKRIVEDKCCKIIVSCRLQIYKDDKFNLLPIFKSCECNFMSDKLYLTDKEKTDIADMHLGIKSKDINKVSKQCEFFPLLCYLYPTMKDVDINDFFSKPFDTYTDELDNLFRYGDEGRYKVCGLALCVIFQNRLEAKWFQGRDTPEQRQIIKDTCNASKVKSTSKAELQEALDTLDGTFICNANGIYSTLHDTLFDLLVHYFGQKMIECILEHSDTYFIEDRFVLQRYQMQFLPSDMSSYKRYSELFIQITDDYLEAYIKRLIKDWSKGNVKYVFDNKYMNDSSFRQLLLQYLKQLDKSKQVTLANTKDTETTYHNDSIPATKNFAWVFPRSDYPLILSCDHGYVDMLEWILINDVDVNQCRDDGFTGLLRACEKGYTAIVNMILENNPNVDMCTCSGVSALHMAIYGRHTDIVKLILKKDPNVDLCTENGYSPLFIAVNKGNTDIVKLLLEKNPNVDLCSMNGYSPLNLASCKGHADIVKLLLEKNPNIDLCDNKNGSSPLNSASQDGRTSIVKLLLEKNPNVDLCTNDNVSPLWVASQNGHIEIVKLLLEKNPNVDLCPKKTGCPLYIASQNGHIAIVSLLLEKSHNDKPNKSYHCSPLYIACRQGHIDIVRLLLENNINVNCCDGCSNFALWDSCFNNHSGIVELFIKHKPNINAQTIDGSCALFFSALNGNVEIVQLLLENNADCNICCHSKQSIIDKLTNDPLFDYLTQNIYVSYLKKASSLNVLDYVSKKLSKSKDYAFDVVAGSSPLHMACFNGFIDVVHCLLKHKANIKMAKEDGTTPLFYACEVGHDDIVQLLLDKGADTQICRLNGKSPLNIATDNEHESVEMMLRKYIEDQHTISF